MRMLMLKLLNQTLCFNTEFNIFLLNVSLKKPFRELTENGVGKRWGMKCSKDTGQTQTSEVAFTCTLRPQEEHNSRNHFQTTFCIENEVKYCKCQQLEHIFLGWAYQHFYRGIRYLHCSRDVSGKTVWNRHCMLMYGSPVEYMLIDNEMHIDQIVKKYIFFVIL